jgi:Family of unknown function (DUF6527)
MNVENISPQYVDYIPRELEDGMLYISKQFQTASHRCCCGCGTKIVTPLRETEYTLLERNGLVSLLPSIGRVVWASKMTQEQIRRGRAYDDALKEAHFTKTELPWWNRVGKLFESWIKKLWK